MKITPLLWKANWSVWSVVIDSGQPEGLETWVSKLGVYKGRQRVLEVWEVSQRF